MRTYMRWFGILFRSQLQKISSWLLLGVMVLLVVLVHICTIPRAENIRILYAFSHLTEEDAAFAEAVVSNLSSLESIYDFEEAESVSQLKEEVLSAKAVCGIVFEEGIYDACVCQDPVEVMTLYSASFSNTREIAKETIYVAFFKEYSKILLSENVENIYVLPSEELKAELLEKGEDYLRGTTLFRVEQIGYQDHPSDVTHSSTTKPVRGIIGLTIFLSAYLALGEKKDAFQKYLAPAKRFVYLFLKALSSCLPLMAAGAILLAVSNEWEGFTEVPRFLLLFITSFVFSLIFLLLIRDEEKYLSLLFPLVMLNLVICPIFFDISEFFVEIFYIRDIFPVGIFLK